MYNIGNIRYMDYKRNRRIIIAFNQIDIIDKSFYEISKELGYKISVTGGLELTHEIECTLGEFIALLELSENR
jgi:hypothetical protein